MLLPKSMTATPDAFNKGQLNGPGPSAGPFVVSGVDRTAQRIVLTRNPKWWGTPALLDSITYLVLDDAARIPALQNNTIDATGLATLDELTVAQRTTGSRSAARPETAGTTSRSTVRPGSILADKALRLAIAKAIDRQTIANVTQRGLADNPAPLNNHVYVAGQAGYQDNSAVVAFDPAKAKQELDALGWRLNGQFREKDGRQLVIRDVLYDSNTTRQFGQIAQNTLAQVGVKLDLDAKGGGGFFSNHINVGDFDIAQFSWVGDAFPLSGLPQIYASQGGSNFGKIGSPEIDAKIEQTLDELDPAKARDLANETRQADLGRGLQPAADPVARKHRGAKHFGELRAIRAGRRGLHQDRLHEAVTRAACGDRGRQRRSTAAVAAIAQTSSRTARPRGAASSSSGAAGQSSRSLPRRRP